MAWPYPQSRRGPWKRKPSPIDAYHRSRWNEKFDDYVYDIALTCCADPGLSSRLPGGPQFVTCQWHRSSFYGEYEI